MTRKKKDQAVEALVLFARACEDAWSAAEAVDWTDAELLVTRARAARNGAPEALRGVIDGIIGHAEDFEDWESDIVAIWPALIIEAWGVDSGA